MTIIGHAALGATAYGALRPHTTTTRWGLSRRAILLCCLLIPVFPDLDVVMHRWFKYGHALGHRGVSHSLAFALLFALLLAWLLQRLGKAERTRRALAQMTLAFSLLMATHGITDTMTTGGKAPMLMWPLKAEGVWFPERFIPVSPMGSILLRTKWTPKQLGEMKKARARLLRNQQKPFTLVRKLVSKSERLDQYRRIGLVGIILTEFLLLIPLALLAAGVALWRRMRYGPSVPEPPVVRPSPRAASDGHPARLKLASIGSSVALAAVIVAGILVHLPDAGISISHGHLDDDASTYYQRLTPKQSNGQVPVAVLVHGWRCSHQMMMSMARALARNGVEVWAVDMPGHARSPVRLETGCAGKKSNCNYGTNASFTRTTESVLENLFAGELAGRDVVLIGHSTGAVAAHDVSGPGADQLAGRIVVEGRYRKLVHGGNRMIVGKPKYLSQHGDGLKHDVVHGSFEDGSAVELYTANRPHLDLVRDAHVNAGILRWIESTTGASLGDETEPYKDRQIAWMVVFTSFGFAVSMLGAAYASRRGWLAPVRPNGYPRGGVAFTLMVFGSVPAALWAGELFMGGGAPWLQASINQVLPTYLMCASVCIALPYVLLTGRPGLPQLRALKVDLALAAFAFATIYLTLGLSADRYYFHLGIPAWRWVRLLGWTVAFLPICLVVQELGFQRDAWWARIASVLWRLIMWGALFWVQAVGRGGSAVNDAKIMVGVLAFAEVWALAVGWRRRSRFFVGLMSALMLAWVLTAAYPILSGAPG